jgi:hypothetical protein
LNNSQDKLQHESMRVNIIDGIELLQRAARSEQRGEWNKEGVHWHVNTISQRLIAFAVFPYNDGLLHHTDNAK